ncbi:MAG TPA: phosphatidylglycerophosphatase A [Planctomycetota bacterium]|nr:phosphatidylglycerophosphatase A [Planctomycetota bacterium]
MRELLATCLYVGYVPAGPGTMGSLLALAAALAWRGWLTSACGTRSGSIYAGLIALAVAAVLAVLGARIGDWAERVYRRKDPSAFVLDEFVGCLLSLGPAFIIVPHAELFLLGGLPFGFFRVFDIAKPYPISHLDRLRGGWGIMLDDIAAAGIAAVASVVALLILT